MVLAIFYISIITCFLQDKVLAMGSEEEKTTLSKNKKSSREKKEKKTPEKPTALRKSNKEKKIQNDSNLKKTSEDSKISKKKLPSLSSSDTSNEDTEENSYKATSESSSDTLSDDAILKKYKITIGKTAWKGGIFVSGISYFYKNEIKEPIFKKIDQFYKANYVNKLNYVDDFFSPAFKGFVFDACIFDEEMLEGSFFDDLGNYTLKRKRKNSKHFEKRTIYFSNCKLYLKNNPAEYKDSIFFRKKIVGEQFIDWSPNTNNNG